MKKALVTIATLIAAATTANAKVMCVVQAEEKAGEYTKNLASKELDATQEQNLIYQSGKVLYVVSKDGNGNMWLMVFNPTTKKIIAGGGGTPGKQMLLLLPKQKQSFGCFEIPTPEIK